MENMADQNKFWLAKCSNWSENGQWPTVISSTDIVYSIIFCVLKWHCYHLKQAMNTVCWSATVSKAKNNIKDNMYLANSPC